MCLSQFIKIVLVMLTLGMLLSENRRWAPGEKHLKTYFYQELILLLLHNSKISFFPERN